MEKILLFLAEGFEEIEALTVVDLLRRANLDITMVAIGETLEVTGSHQICVKADVLLKDISWEADMLVLPGGMPGTLNLGACNVLTEKLKEFSETGKKVAAICAAPSVLGKNNILQGKKATCYPGFEEQLLGATYKKESVVVDGNVITSRGMGTAIEFGLTIIEQFLGSEKAKEIEESIIYNS